MEETSASQQIDAIVRMHDNWQGKILSELRNIITAVDSTIIEEVKWKKPSKPEGAPVWSQSGILCIGDIFKNTVRLTFPKGAQIKDPKKIFNTRLDSNTARGIDFHEDSQIDDSGLRAIILEAIRINASKKSKL